MDKIIRCITSDGAVMASAIDSSDLVYAAQKIHRTSNVATAALGRLLTAASMMGAQLKKKEATISLRVAGDGPLGVVIAASDSDGYVRGYVENSNCPTEHYQNGKLNVGKAVGQGVLNVMKNFGAGDPYIGQVPLVSGEIAEDITSYFASSEQTPTVCALGVLVDPETKDIITSGGFIIQLLPTAMDDTIDLVEKSIENLEPISTLIDRGMTPEEICRHALKYFDLDILDDSEPEYKCYCSKDRVEAALISTGKDELLQMAEEGDAEVCCQFCDKKYVFTPADLKKLAKN